MDGLGAHRIDRIEPEHFERFYARMLASGLKPGTAHQVHRTARTAFGEVLKLVVPGRPIRCAMYPDPRVVEFDGHTVTVEDAEPPGGFPVLVHCGGGSRHQEPAAVREARRHGLRLISYDRPSYGGLTPIPGRRRPRNQ